ncbi:MAG: hypothetical protein ACK4IK_05765 [Bacteroidia bacterium]
MKKISLIVLLCLIIAACKKERIEPNDYPFVFGSSDLGEVSCLEGCNPTTLNIFDLDFYMEIDRKFNIFLRNRTGGILYRGKFTRFKLKEVREKFEYISEYDAPLPEYIKYLKYTFDVNIMSYSVNKYTRMMNDVKEIKFVIGPTKKGKMVNGNVVYYYTDYKLNYGFRSKYFWKDGKKSNYYFSYSFYKNI